MAQSDLPIIATMIGDPAGIGPEVAVKALASGEPQAVSRPVLIGNIDAIRNASRVSKIELDFELVTDLDDAAWTHPVVVVDPQTITAADYKVGAPSAAAGRAVHAWMQLADRLAAKGKIDGWIMAPVDATSFELGEVTDDPDTLQPPGTYMFRISGPLRIVPISEHIPLRAVPDTMTEDRILEVVRLVGNTLKRWGVTTPQIGVAGLNPHAKGVEDDEVLKPAIEQLRGEGWACTGPVPPDSIFRHGIEGRYDAIISMYHDQGQIALKTAAFAGACTIYIGLPYVRLTIPHGTAMDIAGQGIAQHWSLLAAMRTAAALASGSGFLDWRMFQDQDG